MKRRKFFKIATPLAASPLMLSANPLAPLFKGQFLNNMNCQGIRDRILVVINLAGGNDGINTIVPIDQYDTYANIRPTLHLPDSGTGAFVPLDSNLALADQVGIPPALTSFRDLYDAGKIHIIQSTGYPGGMNGSHFKGTDIWHTGGDGTAVNVNKDTGWMGRYLEYNYPDGLNNPNTIMPDPPGMIFGGRPSLGYQGLNQATAVKLPQLGGLQEYIAARGIVLPTFFPNTTYGEKLLYMKNTQSGADYYSVRLGQVFSTGINTKEYLTTKFGRQMQSIAKYISGGCQSKIYYASIGGFDSHANQDIGSHGAAPHVINLMELFDTIKTFYEDLSAQGLAERVLMLTFSEFGRRAGENGQKGTEHGTYGPMFLIGDAVNGGMTGTNLDLSDPDLGGLQNDHRQVYTTLLQDWLGAANDVIVAAEMEDFLNQKLDLINTNNIVSEECYISSISLPVELLTFTATLNARREVALDWSTISEKDNNYFEVQRSQDGKDFTTIARVEGRGNTTTKTTYHFLDREPFIGLSYYRLKQIDETGRFSYSHIQSVELATEKIKSLKVYPNPAIYETHLVFTTQATTWVKTAIYNSNGMIVRHERFKAHVGFNKRSYQVKSLTNGQYVVQLEAEDLKFQQSLPLVVQ